MDALINDGLSLGLLKHPPALKLLAAEAALMDVGLVQGVEPMDSYFLAMGCLIANGVSKARRSAREVILAPEQFLSGSNVECVTRDSGSAGKNDLRT